MERENGIDENEMVETKMRRWAANRNEEPLWVLLMKSCAAVFSLDFALI